MKFNKEEIKHKLEDFADKNPKIIFYGYQLIAFLGYFTALFNALIPRKKIRPGIVYVNRPDAEFLSQKLDKYIELNKKHRDKHGFILTNKCDATLFTGLYASCLRIPDNEINFVAAKNHANQWFRRPLEDSGEDTCYPNGSRSTISRDMFLGILTYIFSRRRLDLAEEIMEYGLKHNWVMGQGEITRTYFTPNMRKLLAEIIYSLGGKNHWVMRNIPVVYGKTIGYQAHLDAIFINLLLRARGYLNEADVNQLIYHAQREPRNLLFSYLCRLMNGGSLDYIVNQVNSFFPDERLPTTEDHNEKWLFERDFKDIFVESGRHVLEHPGGDFIFLVSLLLSDL